MDPTVSARISHFAREQPFLVTLFSVVGLLWVSRLVYQTLSVLLQLFVLRGTNLKAFGAGAGAWAVVTGATDGIGKEFAYQLAKANLNIILVARNKELLDSTASDIRTKYPGVRTVTHTIDFSTYDNTAYEKLASTLRDKDIGILVNNVGKSHPMFIDFVEAPEDEIVDIVAINVNATLRVTKSVLPGMIERKRGLILNIGSFAGGVIPCPMLATYTGTKAFLVAFSGALAEEVRRHNIVVQNVNTYYVVSKMSNLKRPSLLVPWAHTYVEAVLSKINLPCGASYNGKPATSTPYWSHGIFEYSGTAFGHPGLCMKFRHIIHQRLRARALKKVERCCLTEDMAVG